jgi:hypothetical protein
MWAAEVAEAQLELLRIRAVRADRWRRSSAWRLLTATKGSLIANVAGHRAIFRMVIVDRIVLSELTQFCSIASTASAHCAEAIAETATRHP